MRASGKEASVGPPAHRGYLSLVWCNSHMVINIRLSFFNVFLCIFPSRIWGKEALIEDLGILVTSITTVATNDDDNNDDDGVGGDF